LREKREVILALAEEHGAENVRIFGSVVRGEAQENSDIDFLVRWYYARISSWGGVSLDMALQTLLGCKVDIVSENGLSLLLKDRILQEAIAL
jgi:uncharacterized protein